ncbi:MAG: AAA family ATPase [Acidimicrobiales bacterium]|nr:AAA family ATPase [Acidimicrobiales bacterium]
MDSGAPINLVVTKLTAPTPPAELVGRPRLEQALFDAVSAPTVRVVLISAPAGSGKSTLVAGWLDRADSCAWLQLDSADRDPARFWGHAVAALGRAVPDVEASVGPAVAQSGADSAPLVETLANALAASGEPAVLVLDDYHLVNNPAIDAAVEQLIETAPHNFTLVVCTRLDPPLRLSRMRVRGQLAEIRAGDLRFEPDEAATLLEHRGASSTRQHVEALCERTEGWAAGLVLAELSLAGAVDRDAFVEDFRGDDRLVVDYLTDEFLSQASQGDRHRYLTTSILDELSGPLVDAVCDCDDGTAWLQATAATNQLLIGLDRSRNWFRYHHLLRDMLRLEAHQVLEVDQLHHRAGQWHRTNGNLDRAADHLLAAGELRNAADVIADYSMDLLDRGQSDTLDRYLAQLGRFCGPIRSASLSTCGFTLPADESTMPM